MAETETAGFPLSVQQRRIWEAGLQDRSRVRALRLEGPLDVEALRRALELLVERHEILRTSFPRVPGLKLPLQAIADSGGVEWRVLEDGGADQAALEAVAARLAEEDRFQPQDGRPLRAWLAPMGGERHGLVLAVPALCADEASLDVLVAELGEAYAAARAAGRLEGPEPVQYADFVGWQESLEEEDNARAAGEFWRQREAAAAGHAPAPVSPAESERLSSERVSRQLDGGAFGRLEESAAAAGATPAALVAAAWHAVLWRADQPAGLAVGHVLDGRPLEDLAGAVGPYAQPVPVVSRAEPGLPFLRLVAEVAGAVSEAAGFQQFYGLGQAGPGSGPAPAFRFEWREPPALAPWDGLGVATADEWSPVEPGAAHLLARPDGAGLELVLTHDPAGLPPSRAERLLDSLVEGLHGAVAATSTPVDELPLMEERARREVLRRRERGPGSPLEADTLHAAIEEQARRAPDAVAVEFREQAISFGELVEAARALAARLSEHGVGPDMRVGVCMERSAAYVTAIVGVLMAGGCYVPLDSDYPSGYVARVLADADARVLITQQSLLERFGQVGTAVLCIDGGEGPLPAASGDLAGLAAGPDNLAYVIYTSGSTGEPKGVEITHRSALALTAALRETVYAGEEGRLRVSLNAPFTFDASVKQIVQLAVGHTLHVLPGEIRLDAHALSDHLEHRQVDVLDCTPSQLRPLLHAIEIHEGRRHPRIVLVGGEAVGAELWTALRQREGMAAFNVYGPTETTVDATVALVGESGETPTIGRPLPGVQALVLDPALAPVPPGVLGELCIGGWGVARGYVGAPEATAAGFVPHPEPDGEGERLFRTGDLARLRPEGTIDYVGRRDRQVKIRGFRIGLPEIEAALARHEGVREAAVVDVTMRTGAKRLAAFVVAAGQDDGLAPALERHAERELPEHMRPASYDLLEALPVTAHGKVDHAKLREVAAERLAAGGIPVPPRTDTERALAEIWGSALETDRIGINDNFFDLGGDSILQIVVVARAKERGLDLTPRDLFEHPTIAELAQVGGGDRPD